MKNIHWICLALFAFCGVPTFAQDEFREPSVKVGNTVLICEKRPSGGSYNVYEASSDTVNFRYDDRVDAINIKFRSQREIHSIFREVFSDERLKELSKSDRRISPVLYVNSKGVLYKITYSVEFEAKIKPGELVKLDSLMKQRLRFTTDVFARTGYEKLFFSQAIYYDKIINGKKIRPLDEWEYPD
jgi:hypothetical protein